MPASDFLLADMFIELSPPIPASQLPILMQPSPTRLAMLLLGQIKEKEKKKKNHK